MALSGTQITRLAPGGSGLAYAGFVAKSTALPTDGLEYTAPQVLFHYTADDELFHYTAPDNLFHYSADE